MPVVDVLRLLDAAVAATKQMISFTDPQRQFLKREAKRLGISIAELVRRIIDRHIEDAR